VLADLDAAVDFGKKLPAATGKIAVNRKSPIGSQKLGSQDQSVNDRFRPSDSNTNTQRNSLRSQTPMPAYCDLENRNWSRDLYSPDYRVLQLFSYTRVSA
jgi:hypothetical protein